LLFVPEVPVAREQRKLAAILVAANRTCDCHVRFIKLGYVRHMSGADMLHSRVSTFTDPYSYAADLRNGQYEVLGMSSRPFAAETIRFDLPGLWLKREQIDVPWIMRLAAGEPLRLAIGLFGDADSAPLQVNGMSVTSNDLWVVGPGTSHFTSDGASSVMTMSLPFDDAAAIARNMTGREFEVPAKSYVVRQAPASIGRLRALHSATENLAKTSGALFAKPSVAHSLAQELVQAMIGCLADATSATTRWHSRVMTRFEDYLAARPFEPMYLPEICAAVGVSERTLRTYCHDTFKMGPVHFLWLRRMHLARHALLQADPASTTVTEVATDHGFWELGRFSVGYRSLFGESPSVTLQRPSGEGRRQIARH
jgi:AraC-like DNA-binding protein